jgi:benzoyl-CoA 2,3-dioxygenase component A
MEQGVEAAFAEACKAGGLDWATLLPELRAQSRYHVETY